MDWTLAGDITQQETFAEGSGIRELHRLVDTYGGKNWYEAHGVGKVEMKIKELL